MHPSGCKHGSRKTLRGRAYLQVVDSRRRGGQVHQQVIATLGRYGDLRARSVTDVLLPSALEFGSRFRAFLPRLLAATPLGGSPALRRSRLQAGVV